MTSETNLSPDEIQALLDEQNGEQGSDAGGAAPAENSDGSLTSEQLETIRELCNISFGAASSSLAVIISKDVDVPTPEINECDNLAAFASPFGEDAQTQIAVSYSGGLNYQTLYLTKTADLQTLAGLMMGEESDGSGELNELQTSAVSEAFSQMMNASATGLASMMNDTIDVSAPEIEAYVAEAAGAKAPNLTTKKILAIQFNLEIGDNETTIPLIQLITTEDALEQVDKLMSAEIGSDSTDMAANPSENRQADPVTVQPVSFSAFDNQPSVNGEENKNLDLVLDVTLNLTVQLGSTELSIKQILELTRGSVIELDRIAGEAVDLMANGKLIAKGEVVVIEDNFGLRIVNIVSPEDRLRGLTG